MKRDRITNVAASVRARLLNLARQSDANYSNLLTRFALERLLYRLSSSQHRDRFILKGAFLYAAWVGRPGRERWIC